MLAIVPWLGSSPAVAIYLLATFPNYSLSSIIYPFTVISIFTAWLSMIIKFLKPGVCSRRLCAPGFLKLLWFVCRYVCVSVRPWGHLITSGMIWCDTGRVQLVKQVSRLFPAFNYFTWHLPSIKWMGVAILTARRERLPKKTKVTQY